MLAMIQFPGPELFSKLQKNWEWLFGLGILFILLGTIGLGMTFSLTLASVIFFWVFLLIDGGVQPLDTFKCNGGQAIFPSRLPDFQAATRQVKEFLVLKNWGSSVG